MKLLPSHIAEQVKLEWRELKLEREGGHDNSRSLIAPPPPYEVYLQPGEAGYHRCHTLNQLCFEADKLVELVEVGGRTCIRATSRQVYKRLVPRLQHSTVIPEASLTSEQASVASTRLVEICKESDVQSYVHHEPDQLEVWTTEEDMESMEARLDSVLIRVYPGQLTERIAQAQERLAAICNVRAFSGGTTVLVLFDSHSRGESVRAAMAFTEFISRDHDQSEGWGLSTIVPVAALFALYLMSKTWGR